jgi:hypothetical protein
MRKKALKGVEQHEKKGIKGSRATLDDHHQK